MRELLPDGDIGPGIVGWQLEHFQSVDFLSSADHSAHVTTGSVDGKAGHSFLGPGADDVLLGEVVWVTDLCVHLLGTLVVRGIVEQGEGESIGTVSGTTEAGFIHKVIVRETLERPKMC